MEKIYFLLDKDDNFVSTRLSKKIKVDDNKFEELHTNSYGWQSRKDLLESISNNLKEGDRIVGVPANHIRELIPRNGKRYI